MQAHGNTVGLGGKYDHTLSEGVLGTADNCHKSPQGFSTMTYSHLCHGVESPEERVPSGNLPK